MRCASPPERESAERPRVRYSRPTLLRKRRRSFTSLRIGRAISGSRPPAVAVPAQRDALEELQRVRHRQVHDIADALAVEQHRQALRTQALAAARGARLLDHVLLELLAHAVGSGLSIAPLDVLQDAVPARRVCAVPALAVVLKRERLSV